MKTAFITGITGQDGYYLSKFLLEKDIQFMGLLGGLPQLIQQELTN